MSIFTLQDDFLILTQQDELYVDSYSIGRIILQIPSLSLLKTIKLRKYRLKTALPFVFISFMLKSQYED